MASHEQFADDLALYMLGELDARRAEEFRAHLDTCAQCRRELQQLQSDAALYALSAAGPAPPARARERFVRAIAADRQIRVTSSPAATTRGRWRWLPTFAAVILAFVAGYFALQNASLKRALTDYIRQNQNLQVDLERQQTLLAAFNSPDAVHMTLTAASKPEPQGRVIYVPKRGAVMFLANYFAPTPQNKVYQLWLLPASGNAPMPCGTFKPDAHGMASFTMEGMPADVQAKSFAVTMEPEGGSQTPTMPILMMASNRIPTE